MEWRGRIRSTVQPGRIERTGRSTDPRAVWLEVSSRHELPRARKTNGYYAGIDPGAGGLIAGKANGKWTELGRTQQKFDPEKSYRLLVVARGPKVQVFIDRETATPLEFTDEQFKAGNVGSRQHLPRRETGFVKFARFSTRSL